MFATQILSQLTTIRTFGALATELRAQLRLRQPVVSEPTICVNRKVSKIEQLKTISVFVPTHRCAASNQTKKILNGDQTNLHAIVFENKVLYLFQ